jgi:hypothetical protein
MIDTKITRRTDALIRDLEQALRNGGEYLVLADAHPVVQRVAHLWRIAYYPASPSDPDDALDAMLVKLAKSAGEPGSDTFNLAVDPYGCAGADHAPSSGC